MIDDKKSTDPGLSAAERKTLRSREAKEAIRADARWHQVECWCGSYNDCIRFPSSCNRYLGIARSSAMAAPARRNPPYGSTMLRPR